MIPSINKLLRELGLIGKEAEVFGVLLERGPMIAAAIAKFSKLNRTTVYGLLKELTEKGLVSSNAKDGAARYQTIEPELIPAYIERKRATLLETKSDIEALIPQLKLLRAKGKTLPRVQFFEGREGVKQAYEDTLDQNKGKVLRNITGVGAVFEQMGAEWVEYYLKKRTRLGIACQNLAPDSAWARKSKDDDTKYLRVTKLLPAEVDFNAEIDIYDNKVGFFSYAEENPIAVIVEDATIAHAMKQLFDHIERTAPRE